jgi:hypothetical protein
VTTIVALVSALVALTPRTATVLGAEWTKQSNYRMCLNECCV